MQPFPVVGDLRRELFYRGLRAAGGSPLYPRVCDDVCYALFAQLTPGEKTSV